MDEKWRWEIVWSVVVRTSPQPKLKLWSQDDDGSLASNEKSHMNFLLDFPFNDEALEFLRLHTRLENHDNEKTLSSKYTSMGFTRWQAVKIVDEATPMDVAATLTGFPGTYRLSSPGQGEINELFIGTVCFIFKKMHFCARELIEYIRERVHRARSHHCALVSL